MLSRLLVLILCASPAMAAGLSTRLSQVDAARFPAIGVTLGVFSTEGQPVRGLLKEHFKVDEDGTPVAVLSVEVDKAPLQVALVLDVSGSMGSAIDAMKQAAGDFIGSLESDDKVTLISFSDRPAIRVESTLDRKALLDAVHGLEIGGGTALYDAIGEGIQGIRNANARRIAVIFTDGRDRKESGKGAQSTLTAKSVAHMARTHQVPLWTIGLGREVDSKLLDKLSAVTGGHSYTAAEASDLRKAFGDVLTDVRLQYRLTYGSPKEKPDGTMRWLRVTSSARGLDGQGRIGYRAPSEAPPPTAAIPEEPAPPVAGGAAAARVVEETGGGTVELRGRRGGVLSAGSGIVGLKTRGLRSLRVGATGAAVDVSGGGVRVGAPGGAVEIDAGGVSIGGGGSGIQIDANGVHLQSPSGGTVDVGVGGVQVDTPDTSLDVGIGADGVTVETPDSRVRTGPGGVSVESEGGDVEINLDENQ